MLDQSAPMTFFGPFGFRSGRDFDKFASVQFKTGITGCPMLTTHAISILEAEVMDQMELGTHTIFVGNVVYSEVLKAGQPLTYHYYHEVLKGKSPPNAPTFAPKL